MEINSKETKTKIDEVTINWVNDYRKKLQEEELIKFNNVINYITNIYPKNKRLIIQKSIIELIIYAAKIIDKLDLLNDAVLATLCVYSSKYDNNWKENVEKIAGPSVIHILEGMNQLYLIYKDIKINPTTNQQETQQQIETIRKMILAVVNDIRVVLIILALRTSTLTFFNLSPSYNFKKKIAKETLDIFAPLANRLGIWQLKWQLEDLGLRHYQPDEYRKIAKQLNEKRTERLKYIDNFNNILRTELEKYNLQFELAGRPKHIYSIYKKMQKKKLSFQDLYDIRAVRILVNTISDCYVTLGIVHSLWQSIPNEFDDYISHPKSNDYRSLHTVVVGPEDKGVEIQIRTFEMHKFAEYGVAAHWRYKEGGKNNAEYEKKIAWLRHILEDRDKLEHIDKSDIASLFKNELFKDTIYTLTPHGKVISLPHGSTPIDFAYALHTDIGNRCRGAKINGQIVPLSTQLENGQRIEIITAKEGNPSVNWLYDNWVKSHKAISKIRSFIRKLNTEQIKQNGKQILDKELEKFGGKPNFVKILNKLNLNNIETLYQNLGNGDITLKTLRNVINEFVEEIESNDTIKKNIIKKSKVKTNANNIIVVGESGILTYLAKCCRPAPPDNIIGYITKDKGISIHRNHCNSFLNIAKQYPEKVIEVQWSNIDINERFSIEIEIISINKPGILKNISDVFVKNKLNITNINFNSKNSISKTRITIDIKDVGILAKIFNDLLKINGIQNAYRI